jgi:hypothetical protein
MQVASVNVVPETANHMIVSLNGVIQKPNSSYTVSGSTITFASNLVTGDVINFIQILGSVLNVGTVSDATITDAKLGANSVTAAKLNNDIISGTTALTSEPADTDEFLVSDAGTLKRIDYSLIKGGGRWELLNTTTISSAISELDLQDVFTSTYKNYLFVVTGLEATSDGINMRIEARNSSGVLGGGTDYDWTNYEHSMASGGAANHNSGTSAYFELLNSTFGNGAVQNFNAEFTFFQPRNTSHYKFIRGFTSYTNAGTRGVQSSTTGMVKSTTALTGFKFKPVSGNFDVGTFRLYGAND